MSFIDGLFLACFEPLATHSWATPTYHSTNEAYCILQQDWYFNFFKKFSSIIVPLLQFLRFFEAKLDVQQRTVCVRPSMRVPC